MATHLSKRTRALSLLLALMAWGLAGAFFAENGARISPQETAAAQGSPSAVGTPVATPFATPRPIVTPPTLSPYPRGMATPTPAATPRGSRFSSERKTKATPTATPTPVRRSGKGLVTATPPGAMPGQKLQRFTQEAPAQAGKSGRGEETPPTLRYGKDAVRTCLHFHPLDLQVRPEAEFEVAVVLSNRSGDAVDGLDLTIAYDPRWLTFLESVPTPTLKDAKPRQMSNLTQKPGRLMFSSTLASPIRDEDVKLFQLKFKASQTSGFSALRFLTPPEGITAVLNKGADLLGDREQQLRGVVKSYVFVSNAPSSELLPGDEGDPMTTPSLSAMLRPWAMPSDARTTNPLQQAWLSAPPDTRVEAGAYISLQGPERADVTAGETFWVDLVLHNDDLAPIESVGVRIVFDPKVLEVVDEDSGNWITSGINVWDGAFHETYPFDFLRTNSASNARGEIVYQAGRQYGVWAFPTGVFARVKFRAKSDANRATDIRLVRGVKSGRAQTYVRSFGIDRMEQFWEKQASAPVWVRIQPAPAVSARNGGPPSHPAGQATAMKTPVAR